MHRLEVLVPLVGDDKDTEASLAVIRILYNALMATNSGAVECIRLTTEELAKQNKVSFAPEVDQTSEPFENFTTEERNIRGVAIAEKGAEAPVLTPMGVVMATILGIRRKDGVVEFGVSNKGSLIAGWLRAEQFWDELPS
ncbi:MAG: hypothetical protein V4526_01280 [Patescibacteria group bacterium]